MATSILFFAFSTSGTGSLTCADRLTQVSAEDACSLIQTVAATRLQKNRERQESDVRLSERHDCD